MERKNCSKHRLLLDHYVHNARYIVISKHYICVDCKEAFYDWQLPGAQYPKFTIPYEILEETKQERE